jgi:hypothetical protein
MTRYLSRLRASACTPGRFRSHRARHGFVADPGAGLAHPANVIAKPFTRAELQHKLRLVITPASRSTTISRLGRDTPQSAMGLGVVEDSPPGLVGAKASWTG